MWRTYLIFVLVGLLLVSTGGSALLLRQALGTSSEVERLRARARTAEDDRARLGARIEELTAEIERLAPDSQVLAPSAPGPSGAISAADRAILQGIQQQVSRIRGLPAISPVELRVMDTASLNTYLAQNFERDYLPVEREADQKVLTALGLLNTDDNLVQILLGLLTEQVVGVYDEDGKVMYLVTEQARLGAEERVTFAHELTHALQDQHYDLARLAPKHPENDDQAQAVAALIEGDATLLQRLWAEENLSDEEARQLGQGGENSALLQAPSYVRELLVFPYTQGFNFVRQLYRQGGYAAIDAAYGAPPDSTEQVLHPEKFRAREQPIPVSLPDLPAELGPGWREIRSNVFGELDTRLLLQQHTDASRATRAAAGWGGDRWALLEKDGRSAVVLKTIWDNEGEAQEFFDTYALGLKNRFGGAREVAVSGTRQALTASTAATELRRRGAEVLNVISFDRASAEALATAAGF